MTMLMLMVMMIMMMLMMTIMMMMIKGLFGFLFPTHFANIHSVQNWTEKSSSIQHGKTKRMKYSRAIHDAKGFCSHTQPTADRTTSGTSVHTPSGRYGPGRNKHCEAFAHASAEDTGIPPS